jgi:D-threo-aldose 1-dehydrogenase
METVVLAPDVTSTRVGFGCAGLMREPSARKRQRLLAEAFDQGITHFDVARMYGLGAAEGELGRFAQRRREDIVIATKFGIEAAAAPGRLARLQSPARRLLTRSPALREYVKRHSGTFHQAHRYDVPAARASLQTSLRELGTDYVDVLFLHDPLPTDSVDLPEICGYLEEARHAGLLRAWGVAGEQDPCTQIKQLLPTSAILQVRYDVCSRTSLLSPELEPLITFGVLGETLARILAHLKDSPERCSRWSEAVDVDCSSPEALASLLLRDALRSNPKGVVLLSTTRPTRLRGLDPIVSAAHSEDAELAAFVRKIDDELAPTG